MLRIKAILATAAFLISFVPATYARVCTMNLTGTYDGTCINIEFTLQCDDGTDCGGGVGGCDWGDVSATYSYSSCV